MLECAVEAVEWFSSPLRFPEAHEVQGQLKEPGVPQTEKGPDPRRLKDGIKGGGGGKAGDWGR